MAIQIRRGTQAQWEAEKSNIVAGEPAIATDTGNVYVGTGNGTYTELANIGDLPEKATATPLMDGTASVGSSVKYAAEDHVHPSDTSKADTSTVGSLSNLTTTAKNNVVAAINEVDAENSSIKGALDATNADINKLIGNIQGSWKQGGMYGATGIEYVNNLTIITPFMKVIPGDTLFIINPDTSLTISIFEFASNTPTSSGVNERLAVSYANAYVKSVTIGNSTNYIRLQINSGDTLKGDNVCLYSKNSIVFNEIKSVDDKLANTNKTIENLTELKLVFPETANGYINQYGVLISAANFFTTDYIVATGRLSCIGTIKWLTSDYYHVNCYDLNKTYLGGVIQGGDDITYTVPTLVALKPKTAYIRVTKNNSADNNMRMFCADNSDLISMIPQKYVSADRCLSFIVNAPSTVKIKLIGDSITAGFGGTDFNATSTGGGELIYDTVYQNVTGHCWANSMKAYLENKFNVEVVNNGVSGIGAGTMIQHWNDLVKEDDDVVICMIGTNNRASSSTLSEFITYLETIVSLAKEGDYQFIMMASIPASVSNENDDKNFHMEDVEHAIRYITDKHNIPFVNVYSKFIEYCKYTGTTIDSLLVDGLHPNDDGYDVMFYLICNAFGIGTKRPGADW